MRTYGQCSLCHRGFFATLKESTDYNGLCEACYFALWQIEKWIRERTVDLAIKQLPNVQIKLF